MKRLAFLLLLALAAAPRAEDLSVSVGGKARDAVSGYRVGEAYFLNARQAAELYGAEVYWYPVSGRLQMTSRGRSVQFLVGSDAVNFGDRSVRMDSSVLLRASQAWIPMSFLEGEDFSAFAGFDTTFNPRAKFLSVERRSSVGAVRWFSLKDATRFIVELGPRLKYQTSPRGVTGVELNVPMGAIASAEDGDVEDGVVAHYALRQLPHAAKLSVKLADSGVHWRVKELASPRRVVVDFYRGEQPPPMEPETAQSPAVPAPKTAEAPAPAAYEPPAASTAPAKSIGPVVLADRAHARRRIVIDAGHGGKDPGALGRSGTQEKDVNLSVAQDLAQLLKEDGTFDVLLTRADDTFVPLADRSRMANEFGADLFLSLHCNASVNRGEEGFEVYFLSEHASDPEAQKLADYENSVIELEGKTPQDEQADLILGELSKTENLNAAAEWAGLLAREVPRRVDISDRGVKQAGFYVLRGTHAPAILFEMGFITNKREEAKLLSSRVRRRIVDGLYAGIIDYAKREGWLAGGK